MTIRNYTQKRKRQHLLISGITLLSCVSALFFMTVFSDIPISHLPQLLICFFQNENLSPQEKIILYMRMPTILITILTGISLSISGGVMQSITHNDLVSPFTLGISAAAAFGASLCIVFGGSILHSTGGLILGAFTASCLCISLVYGLSFKTESTASTLVLIGIAMNYLFSAGSAVIQFFAKEYKLGEIIQWTFGTFNKADWYSVASASIICLISIIIYYILALPLDAMAANDDETVISLGINPAGIRLSAGLVSVLLTSTVISFTGVIGFVGLIAPHIARILVGNEHRIFLPMTAATGSCLLLYADALGKYILYPVSIPVGIIISFIGVPIFVHLILSMKRKEI